SRRGPRGGAPPGCRGLVVRGRLKVAAFARTRVWATPAFGRTRLPYTRPARDHGLRGCRVAERREVGVRRPAKKGGARGRLPTGPAPSAGTTTGLVGGVSGGAAAPAKGGGQEAGGQGSGQGPGVVLGPIREPQARFRPARAGATLFPRRGRGGRGVGCR